MPGKFCQWNDPRDSKAYCEGRTAAVAGVVLGDNPYQTGSPENVSWAAGHGSYAGGVGSPLPRDCCADTGYDGVP